MSTPKEYALAAIACTRNNFFGDTKATRRISAIYAELLALKNSFAPNVHALLCEALECKQLPEMETESIIDKFSSLFSRDVKLINLYCFPYAGGMANMYKDWISYSPTYLAIKPVEYPGRGNKAQSQCIPNLNELLDHLEKELLPKLNGDFAFFGHSLGAIVSFELACRIKFKHGISPKCLFLSSCPPPGKIMTIASISQLNDYDFLKKIESLNGMPKELMADPSFLHSFLPILRNDFGLLDEYIADPSIKCDFPIIVYGGTEDPHVDPEDMKEWALHTTNDSSVHLFHGDHFYIRKPHDLLGNIISQVKRYV